MNHTASEKFWTKHYEDISLDANGDPKKWLDYSNEMVQLQTFGHVLASTGSIYERRCLDVGCGWGVFSRCLASLGGEVTGIDIAANTIDSLKGAYPEISWLRGSVSDTELLGSVGDFDIVYAIEMLQYVEFETSLKRLWDSVCSGGKLIGVIPNSDCPLVESVRERFDGHFNGVSLELLQKTLVNLPSLDVYEISGFTFSTNQKIAPYSIDVLTKIDSEHEVPNRLMFVALKSGN